MGEKTIELSGSATPTGTIQVKLDLALPHAAAMAVLKIVRDAEAQRRKDEEAAAKRAEAERRKAEEAARKAAKAEAEKAAKAAKAEADKAAKAGAANPAKDKPKPGAK